MLQIYYIIYVTRRNPPVSDLIQYKSPSCPHWNIIGLLSERKTTEDKNTNCDSAAAPRFILSTCGPVTLQHLDVLYLYVCRVTGTEEVSACLQVWSQVGVMTTTRRFDSLLSLHFLSPFKIRQNSPLYSFTVL